MRLKKEQKKFFLKVIGQKREFSLQTKLFNKIQSKKNYKQKKKENTIKKRSFKDWSATNKKIFIIKIQHSDNLDFKEWSTKSSKKNF